MMTYRISCGIYQHDLRYPAFSVYPCKKGGIQNRRQDGVQNHV